MKDDGEEKPLELALVNEQLGSLHLRRGTTTLVKANLDDAEEFYKKLSTSEGPAGLLRIEKLRARLAKVEQGGDELAEPEDAYDPANLASPTHVTIEEVNVVEAPKTNSRVVEKMRSFTAITLVRKGQGWALIAKRGDPIGYVPETKLRDLHFE